MRRAMRRLGSAASWVLPPPDGPPLRGATLRFEDPATERGFLVKRKDALVSRACIIAILAAVLSLSTFAASFLLVAPNPPGGSPHYGEVLLVSRSLHLLMFVLSFLLTLTCKSSLSSKLRPALMEGLVIVLAFAGMVCAVLCAPTRSCKLLGRDFREVLPLNSYESDSDTILYVDGIITAVHLAVPIRWFAMTPLALCGILVYGSVAFGLGSEEPVINRCVNGVTLLFLVVAISLGKRFYEVDERKAFFDLIQEKSMRCQAEHQLERAEPRLASGRPRDAASDAGRSQADSLATTTQTGRVFDALYGGSDVACPLEEIARLGRAEHWLIDAADVKVLAADELGSGGFGDVVRGVFSGIFVAIKTPRVKLNDTHVKLPELGNELRILRQLQHPRVVACHGAIINPEQGQISLVLELVNGVVLHDFLHGSHADPGANCPGPLPRYQIILGISQALLYLHTRCPHVVHGDLKSSNIMVECEGKQAHPKLLDFGLSRVLSKTTRPLGGTPAWLAPEVWKKTGPVRCSADIYSFGLLIAFTVTSMRPFQGKSRRSIRRAVMSGRPAPASWPPGCVFEHGCRPVVDACLRIEQGARPSILAVYGSLLRLPQKIAELSDHGGRFLEVVRGLSEHVDSEAGGAAPADLAPEPELAEEDLGPGARLGALPEVHKGSCRCGPCTGCPRPVRRPWRPLCW
mmetsp:Transcript_107584/g.336943  ORF Transcript_107584/g.336943 Transcript_107584/m.336943 type:complete len:689 (+) Transcript_107584:89-2155(+)